MIKFFFRWNKSYRHHLKQHQPIRRFDALKWAFLSAGHPVINAGAGNICILTFCNCGRAKNLEQFVKRVNRLRGRESCPENEKYYICY